MLTGNMNDHFQFGKIVKAALYKDERFHVMLLNLPEGEELKPHASKTDAFCIVQKGEAEFILEGVQSHLKKGDLFSFKAKQEHSLRALTDFSMLLIK
jgi:quercetin dioxygenase-like cupin family protein